ncbi:PREDICTED: uncharacterized protein LOC105314483 [Amphimedon queenslandica]|uniref:ZU5 domain-containing protein n=1 Tax=Amphimedon queenslandica TaxID=400682 RepID=A0AAN0JMB5_AMPQE|nr:PREDICTED: uncharacterized protein LOC105314483 [Amphimedon queenslandica]|eukprot:XP_019858140.1 PREDICTED: uncharacterized protein LOC105314483 [Amphimedon queenslandica]
MDRNLASQYRFGWRDQHTTAVVGKVLYCWGGDQEGLDVSHDSPTKRECTSVIDSFNLLSGVWSSQPTSGTPPLGIRGVSCTTINNNIYYFGGWCGHGKCYHNSLNCLDTLTLQWKELQPTGDNSVTKRGYGGMVAMAGGGDSQQLLVIGGLAPKLSTTQRHYQFRYKKIPGLDDRLSTNEQNIYDLSSRQWIFPSVSGQCFPPTCAFIVERISHNKGIMYGGIVTDGDRAISTNSIYLFQLSHNKIKWECLKQGSVPNDGLWLEEREHHASTIINGASTSPTLVVIGGMDKNNEPVNDCLLLDTNQYNWMKIPLPDSVTGRHHHTVSSFVVDPNHVFLIIVGGNVEGEEKDFGGGVMKWVNEPVTDPNITMVVELVFNDGQWSVGPVLDSYNIPLWYELILKERRKELNEYMYMTDKVKEFQVTCINESLRHNKQSLKEALFSAVTALMEKEEMIQRLESQLQETEKQLVQFAKVPVYGAKVIKLEDQDIKEKGILLDQVTLIEERMDVTLDEHDQFSIKGTNSVGVQFNYMIPSMDNLKCLSDVQVAEKNLFLIQGDKPQLMNWEKYGLRIGVQEGSLLFSETVEVAVVVLVGGQFQFPPNTVLVSAVYAVSLSKPLLKPLQLEIQHCIDLRGRPDLAQYLKFAIAPVSTPSLPYQFSTVEGGEFSSNSWYGSIKCEKFSLVSICGCDEGGGGGSSTSSSSEVSSNLADPLSEPGPSMRTRSSLSSSSGGSSASYQDPVSQQQESASTGKKGVEDLVTFTAAKKLDALLEFIKKEHSLAEKGPHKYFRITSPDGFIELKFDAPQKKSNKGWSIEPHTEPCKLYQEDIYNFGKEDYSLPPSCLISVYSSPVAVPTLHYSVPIEGVADPVTLNIHRSQRAAYPNAAAPNGSGNDETIPVPTKRGREGGGFDIKTAKQKIKQVMIENHSDFADILESSLKEIANKLFEAKIITRQVQRSPTYDAIASSFLAIMNLLDSKTALEKHCVKYLEALSSVGGPIEFVANLLREKWTTALEGTLQFEQSVKRVRTNDDA